MKNLPCSFKAVIDNPEYRYGDLNRKPYMDVTGEGIIVQYLRVDYGTIVLVADAKDGRLYECPLKNVIVREF